MIKKNLYPIFLDLKDRKCVVVGGGRIAERKCTPLINAGARVTVISPEITKNLSKYKDKGSIRHISRHYRNSDLNKAFMIIAATDSAETNRQIAGDAGRAGALLNVVDTPSLCNFIVPSVVRRGLLTIAISTGGASPALSKSIRKDLENIYGPEYAGYLNRIRKARTDIMKNISDKKKREKLLRGLAEGLTKSSKSK